MSVNHYENFPVASVLLPARLRVPVTLIYRFARAADDFADEGELPARERLALLAGFDDELRRIERGEQLQLPLFQELAPVISEYRLPLEPFHDLLSAFAQDVTKTRYANFTELRDYCRRSANPVGRLLLALYRAATPQNLAWSDNICTSLQIINFLQDIAIDYAKGRIYMPQDELARHRVSETQIAAHDAGEAWREFMMFQIERARSTLWRGAPLGRALRGRIGLEMRMIISGGDRVLTKIVNANCDIFRHRPLLRAYDWPLMFARTFSIH
ncbi:MAG: squalene synthase HpnC [Betaproteobacteria bacterium]|nr:squalene synthase HpnC [Betaproteobacteria bacterium]MBI2292772.1 squalene synthase HpnC [Betaproteobacteria bacterium]MBI3055118.1 squalene synthase HpnC [Betaproteobacteria bacterium]